MSARLLCASLFGLSTMLGLQAGVGGQGNTPPLPSFRSACASTQVKPGGGPAVVKPGQSGSLPPLKGQANDSNGNITWLAEANPETPPIWQTRHTVTNRSKQDNVRIHWLPDVLDTWIEPDKTRGPAYVSEGMPLQQPGEMKYGKTGRAPAPWYQDLHPGNTTASVKTASENVLEATTSLALTVMLNDKLRDVFLVARSQALQKPDGFQISYCVELDPTQGDLADQIMIDWNAAASAQLDAVLRAKRDDGFIHVPAKGQAFYTIHSAPGATLRNGSLVVNSSKKERLGAAYAPAYGPPR